MELERMVNYRIGPELAAISKVDANVSRVVQQAFDFIQQAIATPFFPFSVEGMVDLCDQMRSNIAQDSFKNICVFVDVPAADNTALICLDYMVKAPNAPYPYSMLVFN